jgi:hypothetical protein
VTLRLLTILPYLKIIHYAAGLDQALFAIDALLTVNVFHYAASLVGFALKVFW